MDRDVQTIFAGRKANVFNERFKRGDAVMHRLTPGGIAQFDRIYGAAFVQDAESVVELAGRAGVVPTDSLFEPPPAPRPTGWARTRAQFAALLLAFTFGGASVVLLAISTDPRRSAGCDAPAAELPTYHSGGVQV